MLCSVATAGSLLCRADLHGSFLLGYVYDAVIAAYVGNNKPNCCHHLGHRYCEMCYLYRVMVDSARQ